MQAAFTDAPAEIAGAPSVAHAAFAFAPTARSIAMILSAPASAAAAVSVLETAAEVAAGKRRPRHEAQDVLYFMRPTPFNLERICADLAYRLCRCA